MKSIFLGASLIALGLATAAMAANVPDYVEKAVADPSRPKTRLLARCPTAAGRNHRFLGVKPAWRWPNSFPPAAIHTDDQRCGRPGRQGIWHRERQMGQRRRRQDGRRAGHANVSIQLCAFRGNSPCRRRSMSSGRRELSRPACREYGDLDVADFNRRVHDALKTGGIYFVLDHQANPGTDDAAIAKVHRIEKAQVIKEVTAAGFKLVGDGEALHRTTDDHTKPSSDPAIKSHTDQYMLKFQKV